MKLSWLSVVIAAVATASCTRSPQPVVRTIGAKEFLKAQSFTGFFVADVGGKTEKVDLHFMRNAGDRPDGGHYEMKIGGQQLSGEWSVHKETGHLWIDKVNGAKPVNPAGAKQLQTPMEFYFRIPARVDDPWIGKPSPNDDAKSFHGVLHMRNVDNPRFNKMSDGSSYSPSKTIVRPED